jgi:transposase-like protein
MNPKKTRPQQYSNEIKQKTIDLYKTSKNARSVAKELGLSSPTVLTWVKEAGIFEEKPRFILTEEQLSQIGKLRLEELLSTEEICDKMGFEKTTKILNKVSHVCKTKFKLNKEQISYVQNKHHGPERDRINKLAESYRNSGLMVQEFCEQTGIKKNTLNSILLKTGNTISKEESNRRQRLSFNILHKDRDEQIVSLHNHGKGLSVPEISVKLNLSQDLIRYALKKDGSYTPQDDYFTSAAQLELFNFMLQFDPDCELNNNKLIYPLHLDIYSPKNNFGVEYDGLYWHSTANKDLKPGKHKEKFLKCETNGISLLAIFEDEWANPIKKELIKAMIKNRMSSFNGQKFRPNELVFKTIDKNSEFKTFFDVNHLDGYKKSGFAHGLYLNDELITCASFGGNSRGEFELSRFATNYNFMVHGGLGKLINNIDHELISFSSNRLGNGSVYKKIGFELIKDTEAPGYWYTDLETRVSRWHCQRKNDEETLSKHPTEEEQALAGVFSIKLFGDERPLFKVENYGNKKWKLNKKALD